MSELASSDSPASLPAPFSPACAVDEVVEVMRALASRKGLELRLSMDLNLPGRIVADKDLIQDLMRRVLENSIRFTDRGGITLSVSAGGVEGDAPVLIFEVEDTGPGMPASVLAAHSYPAGGTPCAGLGLPIIRKRVSAAGGEFTILSSTSEGTRVSISIPVARAAGGGVTPAAPEATSSPDASSPLKLLVVEDSDESFALFEKYVKGQGHRISRAVNGALGVDLAKSGDYDLVVMDVNMPVMDGYTATRMIRDWETESGRARLPILLLSAEDPARQKRLGALVGCSGYINKPAQKRQVLQALNYFGKR